MWKHKGQNKKQNHYWIPSGTRSHHSSKPMKIAKKIKAIFVTMIIVWRITSQTHKTRSENTKNPSEKKPKEVFKQSMVLLQNLSKF